MAGWWRSSSCATIPGSSPASSTPSSRAARSDRTRCSTGSWRRPSPCATAASRRSARATSTRHPHPRRQLLTPLSQSPAPDLALSPSLGGRVLGGFGASVLGGAALGFLSWWTDGLGFPWTAYIPANAIGAWLGLAFVLGASARTLPNGAPSGVSGLVSAVVAYYVLIGVFGAGFRAIGASHAATVWGAVALLAGPVFGLAGATWRHGHGRPRSIAVAVLSAALIAEGVVFGANRWAH